MRTAVSNHNQQMLFHSLKTNQSAFSTPRFPSPNFIFHALEEAMETMGLVAAYEVAEEVEEMIVLPIPRIIDDRVLAFWVFS